MTGSAKRFPIGPVWALLLAGMTGCSPDPVPPPEMESIPIRVEDARIVRLPSIVSTSGRCVTRQQIRWSAPTGGVISEIRRDVSEAVGVGDTLAILDGTLLEARHAQAQTAVVKARRDLADATDLAQQDAATDQQVLDARDLLEHAEAGLRAARYDLGRRVIIASEKGHVTRRWHEPGEVVAAGAPLLETTTESHRLLLRVGVADREIVAIQPGDSARVILAAYPEVDLPGIVETVNIASDPATGLYRVEIAIPDTMTLLPGMIGRARIVTRQLHEFPSVPVESLLDADSDRGFVFVLQDSTVRRQAVDIEALVGDRVLIRSGLSAGDQVVVEGATYLRDASRVNVLEDASRL